MWKNRIRFSPGCLPDAVRPWLLRSDRWVIRAARYDVAQNEWSKVKRIDDPTVTDDSGPNGPSPQIAVDADGNAIAVWYQFDSARYNIWAARYE